MSIETAVKAENGNGATKPAESHQNGNGAAKPVGNANGAIKPLETNGEKRERTRSLVIVYFTLFLQSLGLAATMTGVWPFLDKVSHYAVERIFIILSLSTARPKRGEAFLQLCRGGESPRTVPAVAGARILAKQGAIN